MDELDKLKRLAESQKKEKAKIEGKIEALMEELEELGYPSVEEAEKAMTELGSKVKKMKATFDKKLKIFRKKYSDELS